MAIPRRQFICFIQDDATNLCYYRDAQGNLASTSIFAAGVGGIDVSLKSAPGNWIDLELGFIRNNQYKGFNRGATTPLDLVRDASFIVRSLLYEGKGVEACLRYVILKYNDQPTSAQNYDLYYRGVIDMPKINDILAEKITVNLIDGGAPALFKAYEDTPFKIPCNGSIPENKRILYDGLLVQNNSLYQSNGVSNFPDWGYFFLPTQLVNNDGDSFGVITGNQSFTGAPDVTRADLYSASDNFIFQSLSATKLRIKGTISMNHGGGTTDPSTFGLYIPTSLKYYRVIQTAVFGVTSSNDYSFDITISVAAGEKVFLAVLVSGPGPPPATFMSLNASTITLSFASAYPQTSVWGLTLYDLFRLVVSYMNQYALVDSGTDYNVGADSLLLQQHLGLFVTCGDALRASGDPNYQKYYNPISTQSGGAVNLNYTYGPVIKATVKDIYESASAVLCASLGTQLLSGNNVIFEGAVALTANGGNRISVYNLSDDTIAPGMSISWSGNSYQILTASYNELAKRWDITVVAIGGATIPAPNYYNVPDLIIEELPTGKEGIFIEAMEYVFNPSKVDFNCGEVSGLSVQFATEQSLSSIKIGYAPQQYDQKAGKYEYNTTAEWKAPILSFKKQLAIICPFRTDSYGKEKLRSNLGESTSITRNDSDNDVFLESVNLSSSQPDYFQGSLISLIPDPTNGGNSNERFAPNIPYSPFKFPLTYGDYFSQNIDYGIICFTNADAGPLSVRLQISGNVNSINKIPGSAQDSVTINVYSNGVIVENFVIPVTGVNTPIAIDDTISFDWKKGDVVYIAATTTQTAQVQLDIVTLTVGTIVTLTGANIQIASGLVSKLISLPTATPSSTPYNTVLSKMQYGYQYYQFNTVMPNSEFTGLLAGSCYVYSESLSSSAIIEVILNGQIIAAQVFTPTRINTWQNVAINIPLGIIDFNLGDILFIRVTTGPSTTFEIATTEFTFTSTSIVAYNLYREAYAAISGVPNLAIDANGVTRTDIAGAPYSISPFSPKRMLQSWKRWIMGACYNQRDKNLSFQTLSKNEFLATELNGIDIIEDQDEPISDPKGPLFLPWILTFTTQVNKSFSEIMTNAANGHVRLTFGGREFFGFPMEIKQKPALNEAQTWKLLLSPRTNLSNLANVTIDGLNTFNMGPNSLAYSYLLGFQLYPKAETLPSKYHTKNRNLFPYKDQVKHWMNTVGYKQPVQIGDPLPFQLITRGLDPIQWALFDQTGTQVASATLDKLAGVPGIASEYALYQKILDSNTIISGEPMTEQLYYWELTAGSGETAVVIASEVLDVKTDHPDTVAIEYTHSSNTQGMFFIGTNFRGFLRVKGFFDNRVKPKYKGAFFTDEPQDITILNAIPFETMPLWIGLEDGVPDWVTQKVSRILLLDGSMIEGEAFSLDENAEWDETFIEGSPKKYWTIDIRPAKNQFGTTLNADGADATATMIITTQARYFGPNADNDSNTTDTDIIEIEVNN